MVDKSTLPDAYGLGTKTYSFEEYAGGIFTSDYHVFLACVS